MSLLSCSANLAGFNFKYFELKFVMYNMSCKMEMRKIIRCNSYFTAYQSQLEE